MRASLPRVALRTDVQDAGSRYVRPAKRHIAVAAGRPDNYGLTAQLPVVSMADVTPRLVHNEDRPKFQRLNEVRAAALEHARVARDLSNQRRSLINELIEAGYSQSDIAREMGVTRQAVQKMLAL